MSRNGCCPHKLTRTKSISSLFSMKFKILGFISSHMPPRSLKMPSSWKVLFTWKHKQTQSDSGNGIHLESWWEFGIELYLVDNSLCCWSVWGVKDLPHQQGLQSPPDHPGNGARLHVLHQAVAIGSWKMTAEVLSPFALINHFMAFKNGVSARQLWTRTGGVVVSRQSLTVTVVAMISKQGLVVVVLIPVERLDFQAASLRVPTNNTGHGLVHLVWRACCVCSQEQDLLTHILPTLHAGELKRRTGVRIPNTWGHGGLAAARYQRGSYSRWGSRAPLCRVETAHTWLSAWLR